MDSGSLYLTECLSAPPACSIEICSCGIRQCFACEIFISIDQLGPITPYCPVDSGSTVDSDGFRNNPSGFESRGQELRIRSHKSAYIER